MPATATAPPAAKESNGGGAAPVAAALVPFTRAAREHTEFVKQFNAVAPGQELEPIDIPAYGFFRGVVIEVTATSAGNSAVVALQEDSPFNAIATIQVQDVNSTPIYGPLSGYGAYLADKYLANRTVFDPKLVPGGFTASAVGAGATAGSLKFNVRLGVEAIARTALGSLANANSSTTYKLRLTMNTLANMFTTVPNGTYSFVVKIYLEAWSVPAQQDWRGRPQEQLPPGNGTTNYVSRVPGIAVVAGANTIRLGRVGNYIRSLILILRTSAANGRTAYEAAGMPDPLQVFVDTRLWHSQSPVLYRRYMAERLGVITATLDATGGVDSGVAVFDGNHDLDGHYGNESGDGWLPTLQSTRLELNFTSASAGTLEVITNDIAPPPAAVL